MGRLIGVILLALFFGVYAYAYADIYKYVDDNGVTHFTNTPNSKGYEKIISEGKDGRRKKSNSIKTTSTKLSSTKTSDYSDIIHSKSRRYNIEPSLIKAIITVESDWESTAVSRKGAMGLMQLMPFTAKDMEVKNPFDPEENIEGGIKYLRFLLDKFSGDLELAVAAYNAGPERIEQFNGIPPIQETQQYVKKVFSIYKKGRSGTASAVIYKIVYDDGTVLYTNTPFQYKGAKLSRF